jgi:4-hydroxy-tetrahydrodipicolinate synthase
VDVRAVAGLAEHVLAGGVHGIFVLGTMGEGASFNDQQRATMARATVECVAGRVPVIAGVIETSTGRAVATAGRLAETGVDALVVMAPCYFRHADQEELLAHFTAIVEATETPSVIYDNPHTTKNALAIESVLKLARHPRVVALKDSTGDIGHFGQLAHRFAGGDFGLFQGDESQLDAAVLLGAQGLVAGMANLVPDVVVALYEAARQGDRARAGELQEKLIRLQRIYSVGETQGKRFLQGMKTALSYLGLCERRATAPHLSLSEAEAEEVREVLTREGVL